MSKFCSGLFEKIHSKFFTESLVTSRSAYMNMHSNTKSEHNIQFVILDGLKLKHLKYQRLDRFFMM